MRCFDALEAKGCRVLSAHRFERCGEMDIEEQEARVCRRDFAWMNEADVFSCVFPSGSGGHSVRTDGTCVELGWASALGKPIILITARDDKHSHLVKGLFSIGDRPGRC